MTSDVLLAGGGDAGVPDAPRDPGRALVWVVWAGWLLLAAQLVWLGGYSLVEYHRFSLTWDYAAYHQAWYLISHGHLDPFDTVLDFPFWRNNGEFLMWPLAVVGVPFGHGVVLLWLQDLAIVGAEALVVSWVRDLVARPSWPERLPPALGVLTAVVLLVANPWIYWTAAFDFHFEAFDALLILLAARALERRRYQTCALWVALAVTAGDLAASLVAGLGLAAILAGRPWRRAGAVLVGVGVAWVGLLSILGMKGGNLSVNYGYLVTGSAVGSNLGIGKLITGVATHPGRVLHALWARRHNIVANSFPAGLIGLATPWGFGVAAVVLLSTNLAVGLTFSQAPFQNYPAYPFITLGTVMGLAWLGRRSGRLIALAVAAVVVADALAWSAVWLPRTPSHWLKVSPEAAQVLDQAARQIPPHAEVIASQGVSGRFSARTELYTVLSPGATYPVRRRSIYFVLTPYQGIEVSSVNAQLADVAYVASLGAAPVTFGHGVWVFRWSPPADIRSVTLPASSGAVAPWALRGAGGTPVLQGPPSRWRMAANGRRGYVVSQDYFREGVGGYSASVVLSSTVPVNIEVWNATGHQLLGRRQVPATVGEEVVHLAVAVRRLYPPGVFTGVGPFRITPIPPPPGNDLEIRVWSPGGGNVSVYAVSLVPQAG